LFGRKSGSDSPEFSNYSDYIMHLLMNFVGSAAPDRNIELAVDLEADRASVIVDGTRIYFLDALVGPNVGLMQLQSPIFIDIIPTPELIGEILFINKSLVSVNLIPITETNFDLIISSDLLLSGHPQEDAINIAILLGTIADLHSELYDQLESL